MLPELPQTVATEPQPNTVAPPRVAPVVAQDDKAPPTKEITIPPSEKMPKGTEELPQPGAIPPFGPSRFACRGWRNRKGIRASGTTPRATEEQLKEYSQFIDQVIDPGHTLDIVVSRTRLILLKETPTQIQIADDSVLGHNLLSPKQMTIIGRKVGSTVLTMWFPDPKDKTKDKILSYLVRVFPDPELKKRLELIYKALEIEIHKLFPDSMIRLTLAGDKVAVSGEAKDAFELTAILRIVRGQHAGRDSTGAHQHP